jgi:hypothetical protein
MARCNALLFAGAAAVSVAALVAPSAHAEELRTVVWQPPESPRRIDPMLTMTGAIFFAVPYAASVVAGATSDVPADRWLYAPVVGPIHDMLQRTVCTTQGCRGSDFPSTALPLVLSSIAQASGIGIVIVSLVRPSEPARPPRAAVRVMPTSVRGGAGVSAFGSF